MIMIFYELSEIYFYNFFINVFGKRVFYIILYVNYYILLLFQVFIFKFICLWFIITYYLLLKYFICLWIIITGHNLIPYKEGHNRPQPTDSNVLARPILRIFYRHKHVSSLTRVNDIGGKFVIKCASVPPLSSVSLNYY